MFYTPVTGFTALHKAAQRGDEEDVAALLAEVLTGFASCAYFARAGVMGPLHPPQQPAAPLPAQPCQRVYGKLAYSRACLLGSTAQ